MLLFHVSVEERLVSDDWVSFLGPNELKGRRMEIRRGRCDSDDGRHRWIAETLLQLDLIN